MTGPDPRVGEIQATLDAATPGPWGNADDTYRSIPVHRIGSEVTGSDVAQVMLMGKQSAVDAEFIAAAPADVAYLLAELRDRDEKLARVEALHFAEGDADHSYADICFECRDTYPCPTIDALRAVAAANVGGE